MKTFEEYLKHSLLEMSPSPVKDAMHYSLMAGGKRIRPRLLFAALMGYDMNPKAGYPCAAAIEMIHTYSLIHDDLPAMDDDTLRRGQPTCHVQFDEATAILAGDALLTQAFVEACKASTDPMITAKIISAIASYSGGDGMILGQIRDLEAEHQPIESIEELKNIHLYKTGKLLTLPLVCAAYLAKHEEDIDTWIKIGMNIGLSFQIQDDVLDVTGSVEELGKNIQSDMEHDKATYVRFWGIEKCKEEAKRLYDEALTMIHSLSIDHEVLEQLLQELSQRRK